ncbi:MAG TPA: serine protease [Lacunisphaera sp.]|nr:serine protease [Lacunisphaera sp.]
MAWHVTYSKVLPYIVKIKTPDGHGTGFFFAQNKTKTIVAVATALHVIEDADTWQKPIKVFHEFSGKELHLNDTDRAVLRYPGRDTAAIIFTRKELPFPDATLPLMDKTFYKSVGWDLAWAGYPGICPSKVCLFQGSVSCFDTEEDYYLIDGVAISGVSGGPVFARNKENGAELIGIVSEYWSRAGSTPGLLKAHDVSDLHDVVEKFKNIDDAKTQAAEEKVPDSTSSQPEGHAQGGKPTHGVTPEPSKS